MARELKRGGRNPKKPSQLIGQRGGRVGRHAAFTFQDLENFASRHGIADNNKLYEAFLRASDQIFDAHEIRENEPAPQQWRRAFKDLSKSLEKALNLMGLTSSDIQRSGRKHDTPMLERVGFAAHRGLFNVRENKIPDRDTPEWELGANLLDLGLNSNSVFKAIEGAPIEPPRDCRRLQLPSRMEL